MQGPKLPRPLRARIEQARDDVELLLILRDAFEPGVVEEPLGAQLCVSGCRHGLYLGQGWVARCDRAGALRIDTLGDFAGEAEALVVPSRLRLSPDQVRLRALRACHDDRRFEDTLHFVRWCRRPPQAHPRALRAPALAAS